MGISSRGASAWACVWQRPSQDVGVAPEAPRPEAVADDRGAGPGTDLVAGVERSPHQRRDAQHPEERRGHGGHAERLRRAGPRERQWPVHRSEDGHLIDRATPGRPVGSFAVRHFDDGQCATEVRLPEHDEAILVREAERVQEHRLHGAKHGRGRSQCDRQQGGGEAREAPVGPERAGGLAPGVSHAARQ